MQVIGKPTLHPALFYSGKVAGYLIWIALLLSLFRVLDIRQFHVSGVEYVSYVLLAAGLTISVVSMVNLGRSTTLGLPSKKTAFRRSGLYRLSRNPMYVGFGLLTLSSMVFHLNIIIFVAGIYSLVVYHFVILGEERFLERQFGREYLDYRSRVRRYL